MKICVFRNRGLVGSLMIAALFVLVMSPSGCGEGDSIVVNQTSNHNEGNIQGGDTSVGVCKMDTGQADRVQAVIARVEQTLILNPDGTVSINTADPDYASLAQGDKEFGNVLLAVLNQYVKDGRAHVNPDFTVDWAGPMPTSNKCHKHWWVEQCSVDASTTWETCEGLKTGNALLVCNLIPVVAEACWVIKAVGSVPLELEVCACSKYGESSTCHVTWIGAAYFSCN
jgi:hypothetical protein